MLARLLNILVLGAGIALVPIAAKAESSGRFVDPVQTRAVQKPLSKAEKAKLARAEKAKADKLAKEKARKEAVARANAEKRATAKEQRLAAARAEKERIAKARESRRPAAPASAVVTAGNTGELRSEAQTQPSLFGGLFGAKPQMLAETRALDQVMAERAARKKFKVKSDFEPQSVAFSGYSRGTIVIDTSARYLYLVESGSSARRYAIAVGREGLAFKGKTTVGDKQEWPRWFPTVDMQKREPKKYGPYKDGMNGGPDNPLGARAIYLYQGKKDTHIRIHGTNQPHTIGSASSNGCFRMVNDHVIDLYGRVRLGTQVIVL